jgi:serine/threonine protein kinase
MGLETLTHFADRVRSAMLLEPGQLDALNHLAANFPDPRALAAELVRRGWLTPYQVNQLFGGQGDQLLLGSYVLLERLGEGGMGEVFKARNWKLGQIVALKVIRKERMANADAVRRFQREIRAAAKLNHPNIVRAYDADEVAGNHLLVIEYVDGTDLAKLVKQRGPLPAAEACDYIRQTALGLQHAFENGMVHRDIKPSNLLLSGGKTAVDRSPLTTHQIKILDMGLARLSNFSELSDTTSIMTKDGVMMGTPDYVAPEQARDAHSADIRADLYSLGCTFYFLLTSRVPFQGGTMTAKLLRHQLEEVVPLEQLRPELPPILSAIVRKLLAKPPEDRYQTPDELAGALSQLDLSSVSLATPLLAVSRAPNPLINFAEFGNDATALMKDPAEQLRRETERRRWVRLITIGGGVAAAMLALLIGLIIHQIVSSRKKPTESEYAIPPSRKTSKDRSGKDRDAEVAFKKWLADARTLPGDVQARAVEVKLKEMNPNFNSTLNPQIADGKIVHVNITSDDITDLSPLQTLTDLRGLHCIGVVEYKSKLSNLKPLNGMRLTDLDIGLHAGVTDLRPIQGMPLITLSIAFTSVSDLSPLEGMKSLKTLIMHNCKVNDLESLKGLKLEDLKFGGWDSPIDDLTPLKDMPLVNLGFPHSSVSDLSPLSRMGTLRELWAGNTKIEDLRPLAGLRLTTLGIQNTAVKDLSPLTEIPLTYIDFTGTKVADPSPLKQIKTLTTINGQPAAEFWKKAGTAPSK